MSQPDPPDPATSTFYPMRPMSSMSLPQEPYFAQPYPLEYYPLYPPTYSFTPRPNNPPTTLSHYLPRKDFIPALLTALPCLEITLTPLLEVISVTPNVGQFLGYAPASLLTTNLTDIIHPADLPTFESERYTTFSTDLPLKVYIRLRAQNGCFHAFEFSGLKHITSYPETLATARHLCGSTTWTPRFAESEVGPVLQMSGIAIRPDGDITGLEDFMAVKHENDELQAFLGRKGSTGELFDLSSDGVSGTFSSFPRSTNDIPDLITHLTGLSYKTGERSSSLSHGLTQGTLRPPVYKTPQNDKKKRNKAGETYRCSSCNRSESPEWRKGPNGPKSLCNACGLRWAKGEKKMAATNSVASRRGMPPNGGQGHGHELGKFTT